MLPRKNRTFNEVHEQELEDRVMARMEERFDQFVDQLSDVRGTDDEQSGNPFGEDDDWSSDDQLGRRPRRNQREDNRRWESGMRVNIPDFARDTLSLEGFIDWLIAVEEVFEFKEVPENKRVSLIATKLRSRTSAWWQQLKLTRERLIARNDIQKTEDQLVSRYIGGLRVQIMDFVNMFDPMTLSDAYQCALAFEKQNHRVGSSSSPAITGASGLGNVASRFAPSQAKVGGGNTVPVSRESGSSGLKCFNCGEPDHRQSECKKAGKRHLFVDPKGDDDVGVNLVVRLSCLTPKADGDDWLKHNIFQSTCTILGKIENHPKPYKLQWLKKGGEVTVSKCVHVPFSMGNTYKDNVWCDVVPMDACHLLLGRPWEYDRDITHNGRTNTYSFLFGGVKITLMPNKPKEVISKPTDTLLTLSQFEDELEMGYDIFVLIGKEVAEDSEIPEAMIPLLEEFSDVFPDELPDGLPPLRDIQHHIDLEPGSQLPNRPHYRIRPGEHEELRRQVEDLVSKGHIR
ncbi:putative nucleotidyltransferase, ribonuclease H [Tanacetum coccineum]